MNPINLIQGSDEWHRWRSTHINASEIDDLLASPKTKKYKALLQKKREGQQGIWEVPEAKPWFDHGNRWESRAKDVYEASTGLTVRNVGCVVHPKYDFISCSPDGLVGIGGLEIKCRASWKEFVKAITEPICRKYRAQIQMNMACTGLKRWDYMNLYRMEDERLVNGFIEVHEIRPIERDEKYIEMLLKKCCEFWEKV